jgi:hypothetical protein
LATAASEGKSVKDLTRSADYIFQGTVLATGAANLSIVEINPRTAVVRVDEVWKADGTLDDFTGREVTVFLSRAGRAGERRVFFTTVRLLGESLGVQELGRAAGSREALRRKVQKAQAELFRDDVGKRLAAADLVVTGRVVSTHKASGALANGPQTEHDPMWREAVLEVSSVLKGKALERTVSFWYPSSFDVMWARVPKPEVGQEGTWLLHRYQPEDGAAIHVTADPRDRLSEAEVKVAKGGRP